MKKVFKYSIYLLCLVSFSACTPHKRRFTKKNIPPTQRPYKIKGKTYFPLASAQGYKKVGIASWYGDYFHGKPTASREIYNMYKISAAHPTLPMGSWVTVHNLENNRKIKLRINDRGPFVKGRIIDLSYKAARELGMFSKGIAKVLVTAEEKPKVIAIRKTFIKVGTDRFFVQTGSFKKLENAKWMLRNLFDQLNGGRILYDNRTRLFRVCTEYFSSRKEAEAAKAEAIRSGFTDSFIIVQK